MAQELQRVPLKAAINSLRQQLREAAIEAKGLSPSDSKFRISEVELELTVVAEDSSTAGGEVGWWIFKATADVAAKDAVTHLVRLTMNAGDLEVGSDEQTA